MKNLTVLALSLLISGTASAQQASEPQVVVIGEGIIKATPDQAWVSVATDHHAKASKDAQQRNAEAMTAIMQKLAGLGVPKDAITTTAIDLHQEYDNTNGKPTPIGYVASNTVEIRVDDLPRLSSVLDAIVNAGATRIEGLRLDVKQRQQLAASALSAAVKNAMTKATAIAAGLQRTVDRVIRIEESGTEPQPQPMYRAIGETLGLTADANTPVEAGEMEIRAQVRLTVTIK